MKFSVLAAVAAAASLAQVSAAPLRLMIISSGIETSASPTVNGVHFGPGAPPLANVAMIKDPQVAGSMRGPRRHCGGRMRKFKEKTIEISNAFRKVLGLPLIESHHRHGHHGHHGHHGKHGKHGKHGEHGEPGEDKKAHLLPFIGTPPTFVQIKGPNGEGTWEGKTKGGDTVNILPVGNGPHHHHGHHRKGGRSSFMTRMHYSLMNLGAWEGRAVAFVLGCGIGVLLRMFWVLTIVMYRAIKGRNEEHQYSHIIIEGLEGELSPPPIYTYPVDEKIAVIEVSKAPDSAEHL